jgi:hypothetical protein
MRFPLLTLSFILPFIPLFAFSAKVDTVDVPSSSMSRTFKAAVVLPERYNKV